MTMIKTCEKCGGQYFARPCPGGTKPFNDWSEVEVVGYVSREVPETRPRELNEPIATLRKDDAVCIAVALWFRVAWDWLRSRHLAREVWIVINDSRHGLPTSIHALGAACLASAGKKVPE